MNTYPCWDCWADDRGWEQWLGLVCHITHARGGEPYLVTGVLQVDNTLIWTVGGDCTQESGY